ncbi:hypothetical protein EVAR_66037_1 [Eumeta japonica]|uniref:Uncharacterized protein n=1 Tax=Eumeta variegata TaxID=151549 RepID=A0A4C1Z3G0_EUMVA|nr:hypothetical protein EVAR_66037_1 [Eumeta japonica]
MPVGARSASSALCPRRSAPFQTRAGVGPAAVSVAAPDRRRRRPALIQTTNTPAVRRLRPTSSALIFLAVAYNVDDSECYQRTRSFEHEAKGALPCPSRVHASRTNKMHAPRAGFAASRRPPPAAARRRQQRQVRPLTAVTPSPINIEKHHYEVVRREKFARALKRVKLSARITPAWISWWSDHPARTKERPWCARR